MEWRPSLLNLSIIIRGLAIELAKDPHVEVSVFVPHCSEEDRRNAAGYNVQLIEAEKMVPVTHPIDWLINLPQGHVMDCVLAYGASDGREVPYIIKKQHNCKWIQVVLEEPGKNITNLSEGEKWQQAEVEICEIADQILAIGPKLAVAYQHYFYSRNIDQTVLIYTPSIFSEIWDVPQLDVVDIKESSPFVVLLFGLSGELEIKWWEIVAEAMSASEDETHIHILLSSEVNTYAMGRKLLNSFIGHNRLFFNVVVNDSFTIAELTNLFSEADLAIMPFWTESFELAALGALSVGLPMLVRGSSGFGKVLKEVPLGPQCVVDSDDPKDWTKEIRAIQQKPRVVRLKEMKLIRENYSEKYNMEESSGRLLKKMLELVSGTISLF